jgi:RNA polymerase sigma-70 factor (ECF subfamily)
VQVTDWQAVVKSHGPLVWQTAYRLLGNHTDAADCFQETFLAAVELSRRQAVHNVAGLLVRLATTRAIDRLRQRARRQRRHGEGSTWPNGGKTVDPSIQAEDRESACRLREAIGQLPPQEAKVFCLRYLSDMSYRQIGKELDIGTDAVGVSLHRAKVKLRAALGLAPAQEGEQSSGQA